MSSNVILSQLLSKSFVMEGQYCNQRLEVASTLWGKEKDISCCIIGNVGFRNLNVVYMGLLQIPRFCVSTKISTQYNHKCLGLSLSRPMF